MEQEVKISNREWSDLKEEVSAIHNQSTANYDRLNRHSRRLDDLEDNNLTLSLTIKEAIESSMSPIMQEITSLHKVMGEQKDKISELENAKYKNAYNSMVKIVWAFATVFITGIAALAFKFFFG